MKFGNLSSGAGNLQDSFVTLTEAWHRVSEVWNDSQSQRFEADHLSPIAEELQALFPSISHMIQELQLADRELSEP